MAVLILSVKDGCFSYPKGPQILRDISFEAKSGEILAILGPNGAGKTTLLRCVMGMLSWESGQALLDGEDIRGIPERRLWRRLAYVPQARSASSVYTAFQTVLLGRSSRIGGFSGPKKEDIEAVQKVMDMLGIGYLADKPCSRISGGELQMVLIARALAAEPEVLILDEPESNLDFRNQLIVLDTLSLLAQRGMACIFNTHYPAHALQRAHTALLLEKGGGALWGPVTSVVTGENIRKAFGVNAVIGEIETPGQTLRSVFPMSLASDRPGAGDGSGAAGVSAGAGGKTSAGIEEAPGRERVIASMTIIADSNRAAEQINALLHSYSRLLLGRMGMPHRSCGLYLIHVSMDGPEADILEAGHRLGLLPGVSVKTVTVKVDEKAAQAAGKDKERHD